MAEGRIFLDSALPLTQRIESVAFLWGVEGYNSSVQFSSNPMGNVMTPFKQFSSFTEHGRTELIGKAEVIQITSSYGQKPWDWNKGVPSARTPEAGAHRIQVLELVVDSPEEFETAKALVLQIKEGVGAAR